MNKYSSCQNPCQKPETGNRVITRSQPLIFLDISISSASPWGETICWNSPLHLALPYHHRKDGQWGPRKCLYLPAILCCSHGLCAAGPWPSLVTTWTVCPPFRCLPLGNHTFICLNRITVRPPSDNEILDTVNDSASTYIIPAQCTAPMKKQDFKEFIRLLRLAS